MTEQVGLTAMMRESARAWLSDTLLLFLMQRLVLNCYKSRTLEPVRNSATGCKTPVNIFVHNLQSWYLPLTDRTPLESRREKLVKALPVEYMQTPEPKDEVFASDIVDANDAA